MLSQNPEQEVEPFHIKSAALVRSILGNRSVARLLEQTYQEKGLVPHDLVPHELGGLTLDQSLRQLGF